MASSRAKRRCSEHEVVKCLDSSESDSSDSDCPLSDLKHTENELHLLKKMVNGERKRKMSSKSTKRKENGPRDVLQEDISISIYETDSDDDSPLAALQRKRNDPIDQKKNSIEDCPDIEIVNGATNAQPIEGQQADKLSNGQVSMAQIDAEDSNDESFGLLEDFDDTFNDPTYDIRKDPEFIEKKKRQKNKLKKYVQLPTTSEQLEPEVNTIENVRQDVDTHMAVEQEDNPEPKRKKKACPHKWKRNIRKDLNDQGLEHVDSSGKLKAKKVPLNVDCSRCRFKCSQHFDGNERQCINSSYWELRDYDRKKDFLLSNMTICHVHRKKVCEDERTKERANSVTYSFLKGTERVRVCQKFFMATLNISNGPIKQAMKNTSECGTFSAADGRGKGEAWNKTPDERRQDVVTHISSFPCVESHYTRKSTRRKYLDSKLNITKMHKLYVEQCKELSKEPVSEKVYRRIFCEDFNLSFFKPKKDLCAVCARFNQLSPEERRKVQAAQDAHIKRYHESMKKKEEDKIMSNREKRYMSASFDLESVLQLPTSDVSLTYYSRKLCVYNLTVWEGKSPNNAFCYTWPETEGKRGSIEIASCIFMWLKQLPSEIEEVSLYSDTCSGQNRNQQMVAMMMYVLQREDNNLKVITHNFLESGHSMMEVDSMHAAIEREKKYIKAFAMNTWESIFRSSRRNNPYNVSILDHSCFFDFKTLADKLLSNKKVDEDGNTVNWLLVKSFKFDRSEPNQLYYRYNYSDPFKAIQIRGYTHTDPSKTIQVRGREKSFSYQTFSLNAAYKKQIAISRAKKADLLKLCKDLVIPKEYHPWYQSLPSNDTAKDIAPGPAVGESDNEEV